MRYSLQGDIIWCIALAGALLGASSGCDREAAVEPPPAPMGAPSTGSPDVDEVAERYGDRIRTLAAEDTSAAEAALDRSSISRRDATARLVTHGRELYGQPMPVYLSYRASAVEELRQTLRELGCEEEVIASVATSDHVAPELLAACPPHGPDIASFVTPEEQASAGMAALALLAHARASAEVREGRLHRLIVAGLLSDGPPSEEPLRPRPPAD